jgi:transcriptional regulator with XRE-family HTH domain
MPSTARNLPALVGSPEAKVTAVGLQLKERTSFQAWQEIGAQLLALEGGLNWWLGDWLNFGQAKYGEKYTAAIEITGRDRQNLADLAWVAGRYEPARRRESLSWTHHREVAALPSDDQDRLLDTAEREKWSVRALRESIQGKRLEVSQTKALPGVVELNQKIADQIQAVREMAGLSQRAFAEEIFGTSSQQGAVSRLENARHRPNLGTLERIAEWADLPMEAFGVNDAPVLPAMAVQKAAAAALGALDRGELEEARGILERLATALVGEDVTDSSPHST